MRGRIFTVLAKEVVDNLRDRRSWMLSLVLAVLGPVMLIAVIGLVSRVTAGELGRPVVLPVDGAARAPALMAFLRDHNVTIAPAPADLEAAVKDAVVDMVLVVPATYAEDVAAGRPATVRIVFDGSRTFTTAGVRRVRETLSAYGATVAAMRLLARGVSPTVSMPLAIESHDLATPQARAAFVFSLAPMFLLMSVFLGGMSVAIDTTAGERERGSLEPLLVNPLGPGELVLGKLGAVAVFALASLLVTTFAFTLVLNLVPLDMPGVRIGLSFPRLLALLAVLVPAVPAAAAIEMLAVSTQRTFKEAQTTAQLLVFLPMLPGLVGVFSPFKPPAWVAAVPFLSQHVLIESILRGDALTVTPIALSSVSALTLAAVATIVTVRRYQRERVLFG